MELLVEPINLVEFCEFTQASSRPADLWLCMGQSGIEDPKHSHFPAYSRRIGYFLYWLVVYKFGMEVEQNGTEFSAPIGVMDQGKTKRFAGQHVSVTAESFDVAFDLQFSKPMNHLKFGCWKVREQKSICCMLNHKGKYPAKFKAAVGKSVQNLASVSPDEGTVAVEGKTLAISFSFVLTLVEFSSAKGFAIPQVTLKLPRYQFHFQRKVCIVLMNFHQARNLILDRQRWTWQSHKNWYSKIQCRLYLT